ncbi:MAG: hypothetical protein KIT79_08180 [Deltaproteobacteria bacterium]|nr:hypothetical protein [Deltaproteobacteria bacterium]
MNVNIEHLLDLSKKGQWSVKDYDWATPIRDTDDLGPRERRMLGLVFLFTAGVEKLGAEAFRINAKNTRDSDVRELFEIIASDEDRHAAAETLLAERLGVEWEDLSPLIRMAFKKLSRDLRQMQDCPSRASRVFHEIVGTQIILFELALDALWSPTIKEMMRDPFQDEIIRLIDRDESRHLAMDYWLLDQKGLGYHRANLSPAGILLNLPIRLPSALLGGTAFLTFFWKMRSLNINSARFQDYWDRVIDIPTKAPNARCFPVHRNTVEILQQTIDFLSGHDYLFRGFMLGVTGRLV